MNQRELADRIGVTKGAVSAWESGRNEPNMGMIQKISEALGISKSQLIGEHVPTEYVALEKGDQIFLNMMHELDDKDRAEILNRVFEMLNRR